MSDYRYVLYEEKGKVALITINAPGTLNAINDDIIEELVSAFARAEVDGKVRVIALTGAGKAFCAGGDLGSMKRGLDDGSIDLAGMMANSARLVYAMKGSKKPVVGIVRGAAAGAGCSLAACCDFVFASENAKFIEAFVGVGLLADTGGLYALSKAVGSARALQLCLTGEPVGAARAQEIGLVYRVHPDEELDDAAMKFADRLAAGPSSTYAALKKISWETEWADYADYLRLEQAYQVQCGESPNFAEAVNAFLEKRPAAFV